MAGKLQFAAVAYKEGKLTLKRQKKRKAFKSWVQRMGTGYLPSKEKQGNQIRHGKNSAQLRGEDEWRTPLLPSSSDLCLLGRQWRPGIASFPRATSSRLHPLTASYPPP
jgi:hypothetical protein